MAAVESTLPFDWKSHSKVMGSPSGSDVPALEKLTVRGVRPEVGFALAYLVRI